MAGQSAALFSAKADGVMEDTDYAHSQERENGLMIDFIIEFIGEILSELMEFWVKKVVRKFKKK